MTIVQIYSKFILNTNTHRNVNINLWVFKYILYTYKRVYAQIKVFICSLNNVFIAVVFKIFIAHFDSNNECEYTKLLFA